MMRFHVFISLHGQFSFGYVHYQAIRLWSEKMDLLVLIELHV